MDANEALKESEQKRLNLILNDLGAIETISVVSQYAFNESKEEYSTLAKIREKINTGDNEAIIELLILTTDVLRNFSSIDEEKRLSLSLGIEKTITRLKEFKNFLPKRRGQKPTDPAENLSVALQVQIFKNISGKTLEVSIEEVALHLNMGEEVVRKRWKDKHKEADQILNSMANCFESINADTKLDSAPPYLPRSPIRGTQQ
jgi:hypothetical protein